MSWRSWINAEIYDRFVRERPIYGWLNRHLVETADVSRAERILDLGCGTGATTLTCLHEMGPWATVVGVDASPEMVGIARENVTDPRAAFEVAPAGDVGRLDRSFDCIVCNAAFWQFPSLESVWTAVGQCAEGGARFVFNVPAERIEGEPAPIHPFQVALLRAIEEELEAPLPSAPVRIDRDHVEAVAVRQGFHLARTERRDYVGDQGELIELMSIPAMIEPLTPGFSGEQRQAVLDRARQSCDPASRVRVPWVYFTFER